MELVFFRASACALTAVLAASVSYGTLVSVVFAFAVSHILLAVPYSGRQLRALAGNPGKFGIPAALLLGMAAASILLDRPAMFLVFGFHHVCNETFFAQQRFSQRSGLLALARAVLHASVYASVARSELVPIGLALSLPLLGGVTVAAFAAFAACLWVNRNENSSTDFAYELLGPAAVVASLYAGSATLDHLLTYHFIFWAAFPVRTLSAKGGLGTYVAASAGLFGVALLFTPLTLHWGSLDEAGLSRVTRVLGYFHIYSSIALSRAHPAVLRRWFFADPEHELISRDSADSIDPAKQAA